YFTMAPTAPTKLKFRSNKPFSLLSTIDNDEDLSKTWRLMTKVKDALEYGMRLENLSWRLWFMHHLMVHDQKTRTQFKKLS
ncbi:34357_t:CDS:1, partial [Racocetra persica]